MAKENNDLLIPFGKPARVGNFKLWRGKYNLGSGKDKTAIECVHVSNLDGSWMVRIPSTSEMFGFIVSQYATVDTEMREKILGMIFTNMHNINLIPSPALHDGFWFLTEMMTFPYMLLSEKDMVKRMEKGMKAIGVDRKKADDHIKEMVAYRKQLYDLIERKKGQLIEEYERQQAERRGKEEESLKALEQDEIAEQAISVLNEEIAQ